MAQNHNKQPTRLLLFYILLGSRLLEALYSAHIPETRLEHQDLRFGSWTCKAVEDEHRPNANVSLGISCVVLSWDAGSKGKLLQPSSGLLCIPGRLCLFSANS